MYKLISIFFNLGAKQKRLTIIFRAISDVASKLLPDFLRLERIIPNITFYSVELVSLICERFEEGGTA